MLGTPNGSVWGEESVTNEVHEFQKCTELDCPAMAGALGILAGTQAEVESQDDQAGNVSGLLVGRRGSG